MTFFHLVSFLSGSPLGGENFAPPNLPQEALHKKEV
jgi:hypothetical protein